MPNHIQINKQACLHHASKLSSKLNSNLLRTTETKYNFTGDSCIDTQNPASRKIELITLFDRASLNSGSTILSDQVQCGSEVKQP